MVLLLNVMKDEKLAESFNRAISRETEKAGKKIDFVQVSQGGEIPSLSKYSHVVLSGSEASVLDDNPWDAALEKAINEAVAQKIPLLCFCYGHQFLVRTLAGKASVKKAEVPEFGWIKINVSPNPLFEGLPEPVCMVSHYDAVHNLGDQFKIIASSPACPIHGVQYRDLPVWGLQFHPEYNLEEADEIFEIVKEKDPDFSKYYINDLRDEEQARQNDLVMANFLAL